MPLRNDIEQARDKAMSALKDAHDYFAYTKDAWRTIQQDIQRKGRKLTWTNTSTNTSITENDVAARAAWINAKQEAGPVSMPITTNLQGGGMAQAA